VRSFEGYPFIHEAVVEYRQCWRRLGTPFIPDILLAAYQRGVRHLASTWRGPIPARIASPIACLRRLSTLLTSAPALMTLSLLRC
jgi:hypothetical protein